MKARKYLAIFLVLIMALSLFSFSGFATETLTMSATAGNYSIQFGDPAYQATAPESLMRFNAVSGGYNAVYTGTDAGSFYPSVLAMYLFSNSGGPATITSTGVDFLAYDSDGNESILTRPIALTAEGFYTIRISSSASVRKVDITTSSGTTSIFFDAPQTAPGATTSIIVNGYLPGISQYATGGSYGSISTDNNNSLLDASKIKTLAGGSMVSLGSSGYIQYEFPTPITDDPNHPYGIDFVIKGNPFNGNPEPGMVMVAEKTTDGTPGTWYRLAGSRHYAADTIMNTDVTYTKNEGSITASFSNPTTNGGGTINQGAAFSKENWWPCYTTENYGHSSGINTSKITNVTYPETDTTITYHNRTVITDDGTQTFTGTTAEKQAAMTNFYAFGYCDVRNGNGVTNPYATLPSAGGGADGFDLAWAVDAEGNPVSLAGKDIYFVQIYSATVYNAGVFGETSTEIASITAVSDTTGSGAATTDLMVAKPGSGVITTANGQSQNVTSGTYLIRSFEENVFLNGVKVTASSGYSFTIESGKCYQIITQNGTESPYVTVLRAS